MINFCISLSFWKNFTIFIVLRKITLVTFLMKYTFDITFEDFIIVGFNVVKMSAIVLRRNIVNRELEHYIFRLRLIFILSN